MPPKRDVRDSDIEQYFPLVVKMARKFDRLMPMDDLIQEGRIAVMNALRNYNPSRGAKLTVLWSYVFRAMYRACRYEARQLGITTQQFEARLGGPAHHRQVPIDAMQDGEELGRAGVVDDVERRVFAMLEAEDAFKSVSPSERAALRWSVFGGKKPGKGHGPMSRITSARKRLKEKKEREDEDE